MRYKSLFLVAMALLLSVGTVWAEEYFPAPRDGSGVIGGRNSEAWRNMISEGYELSEISDCTATPYPATNHWKLCSTSAGAFIVDDAGAATQITAGSGDNTLDNAYDQGGAGAGRTITADTGAVVITNTDADAAYLLSVTPTPGSSAATGGVQITSGGNSTQDSLNIVNSGTGDDIQAGNGAFTVSSTGAIVGLSADLSGALAADGVVTLGDGTATVTINSSVWDISSIGAATGITSITGLTSLSINGDIDLTNGNSLKSSTTTAETILLQAYDVDNTTYRNVLTLTNGDTIAAALGTGQETVAINSTTWDVSTTGAFTGVADITGTAGEALGITLASDGAADDLTISVTGANDSSVILSSAGTGDDAIKISSSAGGVDVDATKSLTLSSAEAQADAVVVNASAGGVDITSAATFDIDITATGGRILAVASEAAADQFKMDAQGTIAGNAINLETTDGGILLNADGAANGDIGVDAADDLTLTAGGNLVTTVTGSLTLTGSLVYGGVQDIAAGGTSTAVVLTNQVVTVGADAGGDIVTIADGTAGQILYLVCNDATGTTTITPATFNGGTSITFNALGDSVTLVYTTATGWSIVGGNSYSII